MVPVRAQNLQWNILSQSEVRQSFDIFSKYLTKLMVSVRLSIFNVFDIFLEKFLKDGQIVIYLG